MYIVIAAIVLAIYSIFRLSMIIDDFGAWAKGIPTHGAKKVFLVVGFLLHLFALIVYSNFIFSALRG